METKKLAKGFYKRGGVTLKDLSDGRVGLYSNVTITDRTLVDYIVSVNEITKGRISPSTILAQISESAFAGGWRLLSVPVPYKDRKRTSKLRDEALDLVSLNVLYVPDRFLIEDSGLYKISGNDRELICDTPVWLDEAELDIENDLVTLVLLSLTPELVLKIHRVVINNFMRTALEESIRTAFALNRITSFGLKIGSASHADFMKFIVASYHACPDKFFSGSKKKSLEETE